MSVTPEEFMASAKEIADKGLDEMSQRNAISRAYYSAFHSAIAAIPPDGKPRGQVGRHKNYIKQLQESANSSPHRRIGLKLAAMLTSRADADYELDINIPKDAFALQVDRHSELIALLSTPLETPAPQKPQLKCVK